MRAWSKSAGILFLAASSVYFGQANLAAQEASPKPADGASDVKVLADASAPPAATQPASADNQAAAPPRVTMNDSGAFSIQINNDTDLVKLLRMIGSQAQINIIPGKDVHDIKVPAMDLYNVTVHEALDAIVQADDLHWQQKGNFIFVYSKNEWIELEKATHRPQTKIFRLNYVPAADVLLLIKPALSPDYQAAQTKAPKEGINTGGSSGAPDSGGGGGGDTGGDSDAGNSMIVITDYPENLAQVEQIIKEADRRPQQILVEATILDATLNENNALGMDFSFLGGVNFDTLLSDTSLPGALTGSILSATSGSSTSGTTSGTTSSTSVGPLLTQGYYGVTTGNYDAQVPPGGLQIGVVHRNLAFFLQALESVADTTVLANPKVLVLNKQSSQVIVGQQLGYQTTTVTQTTSTQAVSFLDTGTILSFRPFVGDDGYIRMEVHPEDSSGSVTNNLPNKTTTEVTSNVMVKDGNTIVIGGLFHESTNSGRSQIPGLGSLPLVGVLFRSQSDATQRHEVIILLTPHIIKDDSIYNKASEDELKEIEKLRVGARKELMFFGRERLAESAYEDAVNEMNKPHPNVDKAIWHLDCATDLNPHFIEAIDLKEKLTGKQVTDVDNSTIRGFVRRQIMLDNPPPPMGAGAALPPGIISPPPVVAAAPPTTAPSLSAAVAAPTTAPSLSLAAAAPTTRPMTQAAQATRGSGGVNRDGSVPPPPTTQPQSPAKTATIIPMDSDDQDASVGE
jgi:type II secretory pathway component GspD/PulD (secretin)